MQIYQEQLSRLLSGVSASHYPSLMATENFPTGRVPSRRKIPFGLKSPIYLKTVSCLTACHEPRAHFNLLHLPKENRFYFRRLTAAGELGADGVDDTACPIHSDGHEMSNVHDQVMTQVSPTRCAFDTQTGTLRLQQDGWAGDLDFGC